MVHSPESTAPARELAGATLVTDLLSGRPLLRRLRLLVVDGPDNGAHVELDGGTVMIGTRSDADLVLSDRKVSRVHVEVTRTDDGIRVRDAGSKNGVQVGDAKVGDARLLVGARFTIGATTIAIAAEDAPLQLDDGPTRFGASTAVSPKMRHLHAVLKRAAASDVTVLIEGETGTGKEVISRALHDEGRRRGQPFLVVDCGAMSRELLGSELFGHRRGAFTGAIADRKGLFEAAAGGTILLDEIGEMPLDLQPALLRTLESRQVRRLGESTARNVDVRIISATHRDLAEQVRRGTFREDLFFRLAVVRLRVPPLRERLEDLALLTEHILTGLDASVRAGPGELAHLRRWRWPGNIRELKNTLEQAVALGDGGLHLPPFEGSAQPPAPLSATADRSVADRSVADRHVQELLGSPTEVPGGLLVADLLHLPFSEARDRALLRFERAFMEAALSSASGNVSQAATAVGLTRTYAHRVLRRVGLRGDDAVSPDKRQQR
jgi:DNA-binding NtrC family response regulator